MKKIKVFLIILVSIISLSGCNKLNPREDYVNPVISDSLNQAISMFNSYVSLITFYEKDKKQCFPLFEEEIQRLHKLFDKYNYYSTNGNRINNLRVINESYGSDIAIKVDKDLLDILDLSIVLSNLTKGYFNPTIGFLSETWTYDDNGDTRFFVIDTIKEDPNINDINKALESIIPYNELGNYIVLDKENSTVTFKKYKDIDKCVISLGAIAKGYAIEKSKLLLDKFNSSFLIDGGSSSSYFINDNKTRDDGRWLTSIASPYKLGLSNTFAIQYYRENTCCTSVSGDYEQYYLNDLGDIRHHILNPFSGYPENYHRIISATSTSRSDILDGLSTSLFNIESIDEMLEIVKDVESYFDLDINLIIENEVDKTNKKIDVYITSSLFSNITKQSNYVSNIYEIKKDGN